MPNPFAHPASRAILAFAMLLACSLALPAGSLGAGTIDRNGSLFVNVDDGTDHSSADVVAFTSTPAPAPGLGGFPGIDMGGLQLPEPKLGVTESRIAIRLNKRDLAALRASRQAEALRHRRDIAMGISTDASDRIVAIKALLDAAQQDEEQLRTMMEQRAVERYKAGGAGELEFLLSGDGVSDLIDRSRAVGDQARRDRRDAEHLAVTTARLDELQFALEDLRDQQSARALSLEERATRFEGVVVSNRVAHMEAIDPAALKKNAGVPGQWTVMGGAFDVPLFMPLTGGQDWGGGTRTPRRAPTVEQIQRVLSDPKIQLDPSGIGDVSSGQIDGRLLDALSLLAARFGHIEVTSMKSDHPTYTAGGNISEHSFGCAADIGTVGSTYITGSAQTPGGEVEQAVRFLISLGSLKGDLAPHQVISLFALGGASLSMADHANHIHIGYSC